MPELPDVNQDFTADVSDYLTKIQSAIDKAMEFVAANDLATASVNRLKEAIDRLDDKTVIITYDIKVVGDAPPSVEAATQLVKQVFVPGNQPTSDIQDVGDTFSKDDMLAAAAAMKNLDVETEAYDATLEDTMAKAAEMNDLLAEMGRFYGEDSVAAKNMTMAQANLVTDFLDAATASNELRDNLDGLLVEMGLMGQVAQEDAANLKDVTDAMSRSETSSETFLKGMTAVNDGNMAAAQTTLLIKDALDQLTIANIYASGAEAAGAKDTAAMAAALLAARNVNDDFVGSLKDAGQTAAETGLAVLALAAGGNHGATGLTAMSIAGFAATAGMNSIGGAIHWVIAGGSELLAVGVPALYAMAAAAAVMIQGTNNVYNHMQALYTAAEALGPMMNQTAGDILGTGHALQSAQNAVNPGVYELYGEGIDIAKAKLASFSTVGVSAVGVLDQFGAKLVADVEGPLGNQVNGLLSKAVEDFVEFGQVLGNVGHALLNFAAAMPGLAEVMLKILDGVSQLILKLSSLNPTLIAVVMGIEEAWRWSGLLAAMFGLLGKAIEMVGTLGIPLFAKIGMNFGGMASSIISGVAGVILNFAALGEKIGVFGADADKAFSSVIGSMTDAAAFMAGPWGAAIALVVLGFTALMIWSAKTKTAVETLIDTENKQVAAASNMTALSTIYLNMAQNTEVLTAAQNDLSKQLGIVGASVNTEGSKYGEVFNPGLTKAVIATQELEKEQAKLTTDATNVIQGAQDISKQYGVSFPAALALADAANVKLATSIQGNGQLTGQAAIQIAALVNGYKQMDQTGTILTNTMGAVGVEINLQDTKVQQVTQAWAQFMQNTTNITSTFAALQDDLQQLGNVAPVVGAKIQEFGGATSLSMAQIQQALKSFQGESAQVWQSWDASLNQAQTFVGSLDTAAASGVVSQKQYTQAIASVVAQMLPYAKGNQTLTSQLEILAGQAGGPTSGSFQDLANWVGKTAVPTDQMNGLLDTMTQKMANVSQQAKNFAGTLQSDVTNAIASAAVNTKDINGLTETYVTDLQKLGDQSPVTQAAQAALNKEMENYQIPASTAKQITEQLATAFGTTLPSAANAGSQSVDNLKDPHLSQAQTAIDEIKAHTDTFGQDIGSTLPANISKGNAAMDSSKNGSMSQLSQAINSLGGDVKTMAGVFSSKWPTSESTNVKVSGSGTASVKSSAAGIAAGTITVFAGGGMVPGYAPGHDVVPAMLSPGEGILTPQATKMFGGAAGIEAMNNRAAQHFASGGIVTSGFGNIGEVFNKAAGIDNAFESSLTKAFAAELLATTNSVMSATQKELAAQAAAAAAAKSSGGGISLAGITNSSGYAALEAAAAKAGWTGAEWTDLVNVEMREAGFDLTATNKSSGAYGMAQFIDGPSEYAQYGGNSTTAAGQAVAMVNYIKQRYGTPAAAWAHELADGWYDQGGMLNPGLTLAYNGTGQPEKVTPPGGEAGGDLHVHMEINGQEFSKAIFKDFQQQVLKYNARNNGAANISGSLRPRFGPGNLGT